MLSRGADLPLDLLQTECRLDVDVVEERDIRVSALDPSELSAMLAGHLYLTLLQTDTIAFAIEDQGEGVGLFSDGDTTDKDGLALRNVVVSLDGRASSIPRPLDLILKLEMTAYLSLQPLRYRVKMWQASPAVSSSAFILPLNREVTVRGPAAGPLTQRDLANRRRGFSGYLPATDEQCVAYHRFLYGLSLSPPLDYLEVEDVGVGWVVPASLLASTCVELRVSVTTVRHVCEVIAGLESTLVFNVTRMTPERKELRLKPASKLPRAAKTIRSNRSDKPLRSKKKGTSEKSALRKRQKNC